MIQVGEKDLAAVIDIAGRAMKTQAETRLLEIVTAKWQAQKDAQRKADGPGVVRDNVVVTDQDEG